MSQLEDLLQECTVKLTIPGQMGWGTGFFVAPGWILTCGHVVKQAGGQPVQVRWQQQENWAQAVVERVLPEPYDVALLRVTLPMGASPPCVYLDEGVDSRDPLYLFGYPDEGDRQGEPRTFYCDGRTGGEIPVILFKLGQVRPGMSGSPLLNQRTGKVCGMVKFTRDRSIDLGGGAIPTGVILEQLPELQELQREFHGSDRRWVNLTITQPGIDFQPYREAVIYHYSQQRHLYTPTDALLPLEARSVERQAQDGRQEHQSEKTVEQFPVLEGLRKYALGNQREHVLLAGRPGSGKSTTLRQLAVSLAEEGQVPVLVQLKGDRSVLELIQAEFRRMKQRVTPEQVDEWLLNDRLVLLLDGVNEIPTDPLRRSLAQFREDNSTVPMIFTTRDLSLVGDLGIAKRLEMKPLSEPQLREFVGKYLSGQGDRLLEQLRDRLREIAETPLLLKMLCDLFQQTGEVPQSKGELFRRFDAEYERFKGTPAVSEDFRRFKSELLQQLAWVMMQVNGQQPTEFELTIDRSQAEHRIEQWLKGRVSDPATKAKEWLEDLLEHHLLQVAADPRQIEFHHQLFQEYYAAEALLVKWRDRDPQVLQPEQLQQNYLNYLKWTEVIAIALSLTEIENEVQVLEVVRSALEVDWRLGARLAGEVKFTFQPQTVKFVEDLEVPNWLKVQLLGETRSDVILPKMLQALNNQNIEIARAAAAFIGSTNNQDTIDLLTSRLEEIDSRFFAQTSFNSSDQTGEIWTVHVEALAYIAPHRAVQFLRNKLDPINGREHAILMVLTGASELLMKLDSEVIFPDLIEQLKNTGSEHQKNHILNIIDSIDEYSHELFSSQLLQVLEEEKIQSIQVRLIKLIGKSSSQSATQALVRFLAQPKFKLQQEVTKQLIQRDVQDFTQLEELLTHENLDVAYSAAFVLGHFGKISALCILTDATRCHITSTLPIFPVEEYEPTEEQLKIATKEQLRVAMEEFKQLEIRLMATKALGSIDHEESALCLFNVLRTDESEYVCREAAFSLSNLGKQEVVGELLNALGTGIDERIKSIKGLAKLGVEEPLWNILRGKEICWQTATVELGKLGKIEVLPYLRQALTNLGFESSNEVIHLLAKFADLETCNWLVDALGNPEPHQADKYFHNRIALVLIECRPEIVGSCLPALKKIISRSHVRQIFWLIPAIQTNCKFYNFEIQNEKLEIQNEKQGFSSAQSTQPQSTQLPPAPGTTINAEIVQIIENNQGIIIGKST